MKETGTQIFTVRIYRFDPDLDQGSIYKTYTVPYEEGLSVLNVLQYIFENIDSSLSFYSSCRIGKCNGCLMMVNGKPTKVCVTPALSLMVIEPLKGFEVIKDLVVDPKKKAEETSKDT
jgi:succinate dehydrogenase/fumarate reductase iron-sulfur protein